MENFNLESVSIEKVLDLLRDRRVQYAVAASVVALFVLRKLTQKTPRMPPGPPSLPLVGNILGLLKPTSITSIQIIFNEMFKIGRAHV